MNNLYHWFCANKLSLNAIKTKSMVFRFPYFKYDFLNRHIEVNGTRLTRVGKNCPEQSAKLLGVIMDEFVSWKHHNIISNIKSKVYMLKQVKQILPTASLKTLYHSMIQPHFAYGLLV